MNTTTPTRPFLLPFVPNAIACPVSYPFRNITHVTVAGELFVVEVSGGRPSRTTALDFEVTRARTGQSLSFTVIATFRNGKARFNCKSVGGWSGEAEAVQGVAEGAAESFQARDARFGAIDRELAQAACRELGVAQ